MTPEEMGQSVIATCAVKDCGNQTTSAPEVTVATVAGDWRVRIALCRDHILLSREQWTVEPTR